MSVENSPTPEFLTEKYFNLHKSPEVEKSVRKARQGGEKIIDSKEARVDAYFKRIDRALEGKRELFMHKVKDKLVKDFTINLQKEDGSEDEEKVQKLATGLFESEKEILRRRGMGEELEQYGDTLSLQDYEKYRQQIYSQKLEQEKTLEKWIDYLASEEANFYPTWFKYLALRSLCKMSKRNRDTENYSKRSANTLTPFPDLSHEALSLTFDAFKNKEVNSLVDKEQLESEQPETETDQEKLEFISNTINRGDFSKLYAHFQGEVERAKREAKEGTAGEWRHFPQSSDPQTLVDTLTNKGTEWCTAGSYYAADKLEDGEFYIYYTYDKNQQPTNPRIAIYLVHGNIDEVRGIYGDDQDLELELVDIVRNKYQEFSGSKKYEKSYHDMKYLSKIEDKIKYNQALNRNDLIFLYEINSKIEGFGELDDPRVEEITGSQNYKEDVLIIIGYAQEQIAWSEQEIGEQTKVYIGPLFSDMFRKLFDLEQLYISFPERQIILGQLEVGGKSIQELLEILDENKKIDLFKNAQKAINRHDFTTEDIPEILLLVKLKVSDLGFSKYATMKQIYSRALELGLEICPAEVGLYQRLKDITQPLNDSYSIATDPFIEDNNDQYIFNLGHLKNGLYIDCYVFNPEHEWSSNDEFVFCLHKVHKNLEPV